MTSSGIQLRPYQFKPGQSGNPRGKPKLHKTATHAIVELLNMKDKDGHYRVEEVGEQWLAMIKKGRADALGMLLDRTEGKLQSDVETEGVPHVNFVFLLPDGARLQPGEMVKQIDNQSGNNE